MKRVPLRLWLVLAVVSFAGILKATLPPITIGNWTATTSLTQARSGAATVLLNDGRILFTGGDSGGTAEFFNADGTVSSAGTMNVARSQHFAVVMSDGRVLVGGGNSGGGTTNSAEIYDPSAGTWTATGTMTSPRANATAALLQDGRVVIAGGDNAGVPNNTIEVFDPSSGNFSVISGNMSASRTKHAMAVLQSGQVLIIGGFDGTNPLASTDIFDPVAGTIVPGPPITTARYSASATTLLNGQVAVIGGAGSDGNGGITDLASIEIFDPTGGAFSTASATLTTARQGHQAFLLPNNNNVLISGGTTTVTSGSSPTEQAIASSELLTGQVSISTGAWTFTTSVTGVMNSARAAFSGSGNQQNGPTSKVPQTPGLVIVGGGTDASNTTLASTEGYGYPTIQTDQSDYPPFTSVNMTGGGFQPNETVTVSLVESPLIDTWGPYTITADANGNISDSSFQTDAHDVGVRFFLTAVGSQSGWTAENTFTDSNDSTSTTVSCTSTTLLVGASTACTATVADTAKAPNNGPPPGTVNWSVSPVDGTFSSSGACTLVLTAGVDSCSVNFTATAGGTPTITASFAGAGSGNTKWQTSSGTQGITINKRTTTTSIVLSPASVVVGQASTATVTVTDTDTGTPTAPTGTVSLTSSDTGDVFGTCTLSGSTNPATCTASVTPSKVGTSPHTITATYAGDGAHIGSNGNASLAVNQAGTTTTLASSANQSNFGQSVTFTATVTGVDGGNPTGTVTFKDGTTTLGTGTLSTTGGVTTATFSTSTLAVGNHSITASYAGDTNFTGSTTATALTQTVSTASTATTVASSANPSSFGQSVTFTATVTAVSPGAGNPTGTVTFKDGTTALGTGTLSTTAGVTTATFSTSALAAGSHSITASYGSDSNFSASTSSTLTQTVNKTNTTTSLASSSNPSVFDQPVTFTVTVTPVAPGAGAPTGTVTLTMGNANEGTGTLSTTGGVTTATIVVSTLPVGSNGLKASYLGDGNFNASATTNALSQTVSAAPTTTALTSSVNPSAFGQSVTFTATVTVNAPSTGTVPTGETVTFKDNGTAIGTGTTNASGMATFTTSSLSAATHPIAATYAGDGNFATSTSSTVSQVVNPAPTSTALTSATNPSVFGQSVTFTATVTVSSPGVGTIPVGDTVTFKDGANILGTGLSNGSGVATFTTTALTVATHSITAVYSGDTSFATSTSNTVSEVVNQANTTTTVASSLNPSASSQSVTFTATVAAVAPGSGSPTGTVTFKDGSSTIGTGTLSTTGGVTTATFSTSSLTAGTHSITAVYGGDTNFIGSNSSTLTQTVVAPPSISKSFGGATVPLNGTTSLTFTITNPAGNTVAQSGLAFSDTLPAGLVVSTPNGLTSSCNGTTTATAGSGSVSLNGGSITTPGASCAITVNVTGTTAGQKNNTTSNVTSTNGGTGNTASASITVDAPPTISKLFGAAQINLNTTTSLTFTISNSNSNSLTGVAFTDVLPAGLVVATPNGLSTTCGGTTTAVAGSGSITLSGGTVAGSSSCAISVNVTATTTGMKNNTTGAVTSNEGGTGNTATASINVVGTPPTITSNSSVTFTAGVSSSFPVTTTGTPPPSLSETGTLPSAISFTDNGGGSATISYNGTAITAGSYPIVIKATNGVPPDASQNFTVIVAAGSPASITAFSGSGQSTTVGMAFGSPLVAKVQDAFGNPVSGATVMFAAPTSGPSGSFVGSSTVSTDVNGLASVSFTANTAAGSYAVTASVSGVTAPASFLLTNLPGATTTLAINPPTGTITAGQSQNYTAEGLDQFNNPTGDLTATTTFTISPNGSCTPLGADPASCTTNVADVNGSSHTVTGTYTNGAQGVAALTVTPATFTQLQLLVPGETATPGSASGKTGMPNIENVNGPFNVTVNAVDQFFNVVPSVTDTIAITSNDTAAKLPADAALVNGTGQFNITLETVSYNPNKTTITASDLANNSIASSTSPALEVFVVYTAAITPTMAGSGDATSYTLTVNDAAAPNTNNLESVQVAVPSADQNTIMNVTVAASNGGPALNWNYDTSKLPATLRVFANSDSDAITPGGTITISFTATSNAAVTTTAIPEQWITNGFADAASNNGLPLAGPEPTVNVGAAPKITSGNTATFTYETPGTSFTVTTTGVPTPTVSESGSSAPGLNFIVNGDGTATISGTPTAAGSYPITITAHSGYGPDATQMFTIVVNKADSVSTVVSSAEPSVFGQTVTFTATVSAVAPATGTPTGTVTFYADGTTQIGTPQTLNNYGKASVSTSTLSVASHSITAVYSGDTNFNKTGADAASQAIAFTQDVNKADSSSVTVSSVNPSVFGQSVTFTATVGAVAPGSGTPTGAVTFMDGATTLAANVALTGGVASFSTSSLSVASHYIKAVYSGDGNFNATGFDAGSTATPVTQVVNKADSISVLTSSLNPSTYGTSVTFTVTVSAVAPGAGTPTGTVQFYDGANPLGSPVPLSGGVASYSTNSLTAGKHYIKTVYIGDGNFNGSTSNILCQVVNKANATITVTPYSVTYDATPHTATGTAIGVFGEALSGLNLSGTTHTSAGTYYDTWTFTDSTGNYNNTSGNVTDAIAKANAVILVTPYDVVYDGDPHTATGSATGVVGETLAGLNLTPTTHTQAGTYADTWTFTDVTGNYNNASGMVTDVIEQATPTVTWSNPADIAYGTPLTGTQLDATFTFLINGSPFTVIGTAVYTPAAGTVLPVGTHTLSVAFTSGDPNYKNTTATAQVNVTKATPQIFWQNPPDITYGTALGNTQLDALALPPTSALTGWFAGEDNANDSSPTGNNGTLAGPGTTFVPGEVGQAFNFDGTADSGVTIPYNTGYDINPPGFAATFWVKGSQNTNGTETLLDKSRGFTDNTGWSFDVNSSTGILTFSIGQGGASPCCNQFTTVSSTVNILDGNFHYIAGSWDATASTMSLYIDGVLQATTPVTSGPANNTRNLNIGYSWGGGTPTSFFVGVIDEVQIYDLPAPAGTYAYTPASGTVLNAGKNQTLSVTFTPNDTTDLNTAADSVSINVNAAPLTITANNQTKVYGATFTFAGTEFMTNGLVNGDTVTSVTLNSAGAAATASVSSSPYAIVPSAAVFGKGTASNYYIKYMNGNFTVTPAGTSTAVSSSLNPSIFGEAVTFTAIVTNASGTSAVPTGSVQFVVDGSNFGSPVALDASGHATSGSISNLAVNNSPHTVTVNYVNADGNFTSSNGTLIGGQTVNPVMTSTGVMSLANPSTFGQPVTFTATVTNASGTGVTPTGAVQFAVDGTNLGSPVALTAGGTATSMATATIPVSGSPHAVTAAFVNGDGNFSNSNGSLSPGQTVTAAPTMTMVSSSINPSVYGNSVMFTATVTNATPGGVSTATPTGSVQFVVDGSNFGPVVALTGGTAMSVPTTALTVPGPPHTITANYLNYDKDFQNSVGTLSGGQTVDPAQLTITAASVPMTYGEAVPMISAGYSRFVNGETSAVFSATGNTPPSCGTTATSLSPVSMSPYVSSCSGAMDPNYTITYIPGIVTVMQATTGIGVAASPNPATFMQLVTITATVTPEYSGVPTGTVTFYNNGTSIGTVTLSNSCGTPPCPDVAVLPISTLSDNATDNLTATYAGDGNFTGSTTATAFPETVQPAPVVSLNPMFVSFGNQNVNTSSKGAPITLSNIGDATLNISSGGISIAGANYAEFSETNTCGSSVAAGKSCTITVVFSPADTGVATATLQVTDNDDDSAGSQQTVALTGAGLSTISGGSLYTDAIFAATSACGSLSLSGGSTVDSFSSSAQGGYSASHQLNGGNVGTNGNVTLNGKNSEIFGTAAVDSTTSGTCTSSSVTGLTATGGATVLGGLEPLNGPIVFSNPAGPSSPPPTTSWNVTSCPSGMTGCSNSGTKAVTLAPGTYGNVSISGGTTAYFSTGTYNFNSLTLSGKSVLHVNPGPGPVVVYLAGASLSGGNPALDVSGGSIENPSGVAANLQFNYPGSRAINLTGGSLSYATVYAPKALVNMSGGTDFFGSIIGGTVTSSGGTAVHYDTALPDIKLGNYIWFTAVANNVTGLPSKQQVKLYLTNSTISFTAGAGATPYTVQVPNAVVTFNSTALGSGATTSYDTVNSRWSTAVSASGLTGNTFVAGVAFPVPVDFPTGIQNVTWSASFSTDTPGIGLQWQWGAAVYTSFNSTYAMSGNNNVLGVNPEDGSADANGTDPAGTPESYKNNVTFGATGGGLNNYVGFLSPGAMVIPTIAPMSVSPSSLDFGAVSVIPGPPMTPATAVLSNNDSAAHNLNSITIMGTDMGDFPLVPNSAATPNNCLALSSLPSGGNCTLYVTFAPTDTGTRTAKVVINDDANNSPQTVYLTGTGQ